MLNVVQLATTNPYIPWNVNQFYVGMGNLRSTFGVVINAGFWIFLLITGIYLVIKVVGSIGQ